MKKKLVLNVDIICNTNRAFFAEELGRLNDVGGANDFKYANKTHCAAHIIATVSVQANFAI